MTSMLSVPWNSKQTNKRILLASVTEQAGFSLFRKHNSEVRFTLDVAQSQGVKVTFLWAVSTCTQLRKGSVNLICNWTLKVL